MRDIAKLMSVVPPKALPLVGVASVWLWNLAQEGLASAHCVDGCLTLHHALAHFGIASHVEAVAVRVGDGSSHTLYGERPRYNADGSFNGHTVLVVTGADRFIDPTIQQFAEVPRTRAAALPMQAQLPVPGGLGDQPIAINRGDHIVVYQPVTAGLRQAWRSPNIEARAGDYRRAGAELAANVIAMLQLDGLRQRADRSPYPRLRALLAALEGTDAIADSRGWRFVDPQTGVERRLTDIP
jgi:hypothetical protein